MIYFQEEATEAAIVRIWDCYGHQTPVSRIINSMIRDRKNGGHPNLV